MKDIIIADESQIKSALARIDAKKELREALVGLARNESIQPTTVVMDLPASRGDCLIFPASAPSIGVLGAKLSPWIPARKEKGLDAVTAYNIVLSSDTGELLMVCDANYLTKVRTGAHTSLAIDCLLPSSAKVAAVIGLGPVGIEHLRFESARGYEEIRVYSPSAAKRAAAVQQVCPQAIFADSVKQAVKDADVIMLCTGSSTPVINFADVKVGALITSTGSDAGGYEIEPADLPRMDVYSGHRAMSMIKSSEFKKVIADGIWSEADLLADTIELMSGQKKPADSGRTRYWSSVGFGLQDIAVSKAIYDILKAA